MLLSVKPFHNLARQQ